MKHQYRLSLRWHRWLLGSMGVLVVLAVAIFLASNYLLAYSLCPPMKHGHNLPWRLNNIIGENPQLRPWADSLKRAHALRDTFITMPSGERHHATYICAPRPTNRVAVLIHGYRDNGMGMMHIASIYSRLGYHLLLPDLHAHGRSQGKDVQMGWKDRLDAMRWMEVANERFGHGADTRMVVHGVSMGAATTMCIAGEATPSYAKAFVEDCGYTSVWDQFAHTLNDEFHLPPFPLLYTSSALCEAKYGWRFGEASPLRQVARCHKPMLFIHGDADTYVPFSMMSRLYAAKPQPKSRWVSHGSIHAMSFRDHPAEYAQQVAQFVNKYVGL